MKALCLEKQRTKKRREKSISKPEPRWLESENGDTGGDTQSILALCGLGPICPPVRDPGLFYS